MDSELMSSSYSSKEKIGDEAVQDEGFETNLIRSEDMELNISLVFEKIENFAQRISQLIESGKTMFKDLCNEFEEKLIMIHRSKSKNGRKKSKNFVHLMHQIRKPTLFCKMLDMYFS